MTNHPGLRPEYVAAVEFVSASLGKDRPTLTRVDFICALALAYQGNKVELIPALHLLIDFAGLRELYCHGPVPRRAPRAD
jgi:hypothetical protein